MIMVSLGLHRNIVHLHEIQQCNGWQILILDYAPAGDVFHYILERSCLEPLDAAHLFEQLCTGLAFLHGQSVVHRDVKPENILLKHEGSDLVPMLADFGLACFCHAGCRSLLSTPQYRAREIWYLQDMSRKQTCSDAKVDLWSAGVTLFAMLAGEMPFDDEDLERQICAGDYYFDFSYWKKPLLGLHHVISCLLILDPALRFCSLDARAATLATLL